MDDATKSAVLKVLQESHDGFVGHEFKRTIYSGLSWRCRVINWFAARLGGDQPPFIDPINYSKIFVRPLSQYVNLETIDKAMRELAPEPQCKRCGSKRLSADPSGYYCDAINYNGAELLCLDCEN